MELKQIRQHVTGKLEQDFYMQAHHIRLLHVEVDCARLSMAVTKEALNGFGCVHGGALFGLADTTAGVAAFTDGRHYVTQSGNFHFIGNVSSGEIFAEGHVIHRGRTISVVEVKVYSQEGKLLGDGTYDMFAVNKPFRNAQKTRPAAAGSGSCCFWVVFFRSGVFSEYVPFV